MNGKPNNEQCQWCLKDLRVSDGHCKECGIAVKSRWDAASFLTVKIPRPHSRGVLL